MSARLAVALCLLAACAPSRPAASPLDADLRAHLATLGASDALDVLVGLAPSAPSDATTLLGDAGLEVRTVVPGDDGTVVIARGTPAAVERAGALPWVASVSRSYERPSLAP